ncbi:MAG: 5-methyltetrahydropteroyltriglutamate--homocysteine S-methyltransferase [Ignavibacteria bacterium]|jgi:5-methyltetrahydropteroyltriglutamate--homocysteine methyltransferase
MLKNNLGMPRIGLNRELKKACEKYWAGKISGKELFETGHSIRKYNLELQLQTGIDLIPCNDFSYYDQVLDMSLMVGNIPKRYNKVLNLKNSEIDLYFAMARGYQSSGIDITAMEMTKWFDTNYHYIVPEFHKDQTFELLSSKVVDEFIEAKEILGKTAKPVLIGPVSYLLLGKEKERGFHRIDLIKNLLPVYLKVLDALSKKGAEWIQFDEPFLALDLTDKEKDAFVYCYNEIGNKFPGLKILLATYFEGLRDNTELAGSLPVNALHIDLVRDAGQLKNILKHFKGNKILSIGLVDGRNIWKNNYEKSVSFINEAIQKLGEKRVMVAPSCSLLHTPFDLDLETGLDPEIKNWMAFTKQKLNELNELHKIFEGDKSLLEQNLAAINSRKNSILIHKKEIKDRAASITEKDIRRISDFETRRTKQKEEINLPIFPTTTIGSFPQTQEIRRLRARLKKNEITLEQYEKAIESEIEKTIRFQEEAGIDVLVHGEFERNDMVEYFGEQLEGFVFTKNGWVQSYGSRCVKPPVIYGDVERTKDMTVRWSKLAQSKTGKLVKGMLTGPVTILQWSFVRDDQPRSETTMQIALALRDEVIALEKAGIKIIQIDEPAIREGLPLRKNDWKPYLDWAVKAFRIASSGVKDETQIHTHMCYSEFNDIIESITEMDADVITIETSRSQMELLDAFVYYKYPNEIGPGVYDIHSPRVPSVEEMVELLKKAARILPPQNIWVNPDCGLKTRKWEETEASLKNMVNAAGVVRSQFKIEI